MRHSIYTKVLLAALVAALMLTGVATAQQVDAGLQARLLERSDGSLYVYKDGARYAIQPADLSDADIDAIPVAGGADRVDELFAQSPSADATAATPAPPANPALPEPGTLLYQVDWSAGANGWALPGDWHVVTSVLGNDGSITDVSVIASPYEPPSPDYAVEADIQAVKYNPAFGPHGFGVLSRGDARNEYHGGMLDAGRNAGVNLPGAQSAIRAFNPGTAWHIYRLETKGDKFRLLIDGVLWTEGPTPNTAYTPSGRITGLWAQASQINVRAFRVFAL